MSSQPIKIKQLGLKKSSRPSDDDNAGFEVESGKAKPLYKESQWQGKTKGGTKHNPKFSNYGD